MKSLAPLFLLLAGCSSIPDAPASPAKTFFDNFAQLCGKSFEGRLVAGDESDAAFANADMQAHVTVCDASKIEISFDVGEDRSRTWIISKVGEGLRLKHRHLLKDGREDPVSQYGGDTITTGSMSRQEFPADDYSKDMFTREGRTVSTANVWAFEIEPGRSFTYELARPNRLFRVQFDVTKPLKSIAR